MNLPLSTANIVTMDLHHHGSHGCHVTLSQVPPLDEVTIFSLTETEQSCSSCDIHSDISSVDESCCDDDDRTEEKRPDLPRSIFSSYWTSHQSPRIGLQRQSIPSTSLQDADTKADTYEKALQDYEETRPERFTVLQSTMSLPEMAKATGPKSMSRTPRSDSILEKKAPSCLRPRAQRNRPLSVRFCESVEIKEFHPPTATWAPRGWSDYFF